MNEKWVMAAKKADFNLIAKKFSIDPVIARLIRNRDVIEDGDIRTYLYGGIEDLHAPQLLADMDKTVGILLEKKQQQKKIRIIGDYDIDGVMSSYILYDGLKQSGLEADVMIPERIADGYGLNERLILKAYEDGCDTILTCDNGISAFEQVAKARELGMTVLITDHHELQDGKMPEADGVINPKRKDCNYPFSGLCGAAVAYKLIEAYYQQLGLPQKAAKQYLEYAAFATIGDVMDLTGENRVLVKEGLKMMRRTANCGLRELMRVNQIEPENLSAYHIGFVLGPCLNASGRLDTAGRALALLQSSDEQEAARLAGDLKNLNDSRKSMTEIGKMQAIEQVEKSHMAADKVYVIYLPDCHESLAGIIAGRIREIYNHPVLVLTKGEEGVKGSGRSIEAYDMFAEMEKCKDLFTKFGGHKMAAGFSLEEENIENLRRQLNDNCTLTKEDYIPKVVIDVPMPLAYVSEELIEQLSLLEPFGKANTKPLFAQKNVSVLNHRIVGKNKNVITMNLDDGAGRVLEGISFSDAQELEQMILTGKQLTIAYYPTIKEYRGNRSIQIVISHFC